MGSKRQSLVRDVERDTLVIDAECDILVIDVERDILKQSKELSRAFEEGLQTISLQ